MADELDGGGVEAWLRAFTASFRASREELDDLDRRSGDGDFGTNLLAAIERADAELAGGAQVGAGGAFAALAGVYSIDPAPPPAARPPGTKVQKHLPASYQQAAGFAPGDVGRAD